MRMSELSRAAGVPVATIKYYLREGLLPPGEQTSATQARYDDQHVRRLRLVRALTDVGGLSLAAVRDVLGALSTGADASAGLVAEAVERLPPAVPQDIDVSEAIDACALLGWSVDPRSRALRQLQAAMEGARAAGLACSPERLQIYGEPLRRIAHEELLGSPRESPEDAAQYAVVGTLMFEPVILALRRLAHQVEAGPILGG